MLVWRTAEKIQYQNPNDSQFPLVDFIHMAQGPGRKEMTHLFQNGPYVTWPGDVVRSGWMKWIDGRFLGTGGKVND